MSTDAPDRPEGPPTTLAAASSDGGADAGAEGGSDGGAEAGGEGPRRRRRRRRRGAEGGPDGGGEPAGDRAASGDRAPSGDRATSGDRASSDTSPRGPGGPAPDTGVARPTRTWRGGGGPAAPRTETTSPDAPAVDAGAAATDGSGAPTAIGAPAAEARPERSRRERGRGERSRGGDRPAGGGDRPAGGGRGERAGGGDRGRGGRPPGGDRAGPGDRPAGDIDRPIGEGERTAGAPRPPGERPAGGRDRGPRGGEPAGGGRGPRGGDGRPDARPDARGDARGDGRGRGPERPRDASAPAAARTYEPATARLEARRGTGAPDETEPEVTSGVPSIAWGTDEDGPPPVVTLAPDLPTDAPVDDLDPLTYPLLEAPRVQLGDDVAVVVGVRFVPAGRVSWCDIGDAHYTPGERVMVDAERGARLGWIATAPQRRAVRDRNLRRVIRRAGDQDLRGEREGEAERAKALRICKDVAAALRLPLKVFRVEVLGTGRNGKLNVYYTSDERLDLREFLRDVGNGTGARIELRQLGVRDEAKAVGGIGSCGLTLCCTTWLPDFVPVSIKMAKDQGLVLSPTKVSGQCGRLKCCLVYEQAGYAELRKGLPKLGKRVISPRGEGRVVEVDVLRQRVRVSYGMGDTEVLPATDVKPLFPPGGGPGPARADEPDTDDSPDSPPEVTDPTASAGSTDDPSSDDYQA